MQSQGHDWKEPSTPPDERATEARVRAQLERILASPTFQGAERRSKLLRYLVEQTLADPAGPLKESVIATEVFQRPADYDPQVDSIVRVEIGRLRSRLAEFYGQAGGAEPVLIEIPKGGYRPVFTMRAESAESPARSSPAAAQAISLPDAPTTPRVWALLMATLALAVLAGVVIAWRVMTQPPAPPSIAVLPFLNLSGDPANEYLGDGISDEVTEDLAESPGLRVVARTSAFQFKGKNLDMREIGERLSAAAVLEGSVGRRGEQLHLVAQLIRARDGYHIWSETFDGGAADLPELESRIAQSVRDKLSVGERRNGSAAASGSRSVGEIRTARNPEAHDLYLRASLEFSRRTVDGSRKAIELAQQASDKDPTYAAPFVLMAAAESQLTTLLMESPHLAAERERRDVSEALALDPNNMTAHGLKAMLDYVDDWNWPEAEREFQQALSPGSHGSVENLYGWCLMTRGRFAESRTHLQIAAELDPLSLGPQLNEVLESIFEGQRAAAKGKLGEILKRAPDNPVALAQRLLIAVLEHDCGAATPAARTLTARYPNLPFTRLGILEMDSACQRESQAEADLAEIVHSQADRQQSPYSLADIFFARGETDRAFEYLNRSAELREPSILYLKIDHTFDKARTDPRLVALEQRLGLE